MELSGAGKSPNTSLSFRYNANNEELEELFNACDDDPPTPQTDPPSTPQNENASPKRGDRTPSIIDKYFKSIRTEKLVEKTEDIKPVDAKSDERPTPPKEVSSSPMKDYLNRLTKKNVSDISQESKEGSNETWKIFHDFKFKIAQAVEDMKTRSGDETKEKSVPRDNSISDSEENSAVKDSDQQSVGDTDNQVSSLDSSIQNLSEITQPLTAKPTELSLPVDNKNNSDSSDDTHKNLNNSDSMDVTKEPMSESMLDVESGIEALEDNIDGFGDITSCDTIGFENTKPYEPSPSPPPSPTNSGLPPSKTNLQNQNNPNRPKTYFFNFTMYLLTFLLLVNYMLFPNSNIWNGFLLGIWFFCFASNAKHWLLDNYFSDWEPQKGNFFQLKRSSTTPITYTIPSVKEHRPLKKYEGWINHYRYPDYDPYTYHINKTTTAFMKLEGCNLRISYTRTKIAKRALWDEKIDKVMFYQHRLYNLSGARIILLPKGLVKRRQWSKKYPICVILNEKEKIQVLEKETTASERKTSDAANEKKKETPETESAETNTSPEKKRKFVWRRREKSISQPETETGKEGLRQRFARKMHKDKKAETPTETVDSQTQSQGQSDDVTLNDIEMEVSKSATSTKDDLDEDIDENELSKIKEFLEEAEMETGADGTTEGEWSVHVKHSKDKHSHLYLFARTGRDKHEWFRRLSTAIAEANAASSDSSGPDDKSNDTNENKDGIELAVYKFSEKDTVAFAKTSNKSDTGSEGVTISSLGQTLPSDSEAYEKNFWPYLIKIIQPKSPSPDCECRTLPAELTWVNTALARVAYDVMRDPVIIARVQNRIQRKLNTLKLPSFMSPLTVTSLSLAGACPALGGVAARWDARGVWLDADLRYDGGAHIALLTQINLMKLKEKNMTLEEQLLEHSENVVESDTCATPTCGAFSEKQLRKRKPAIYDSDIEDSAESSSDDESPPVQPVDSADNLTVSESPSTTTEGGSSKKKFLRMVDKIATNKYFQQVTDYKYVKRAMEGLSNTDIKLHLEIQGLEGRLSFNLPPPPHDRVWIGFRTNPQLVLKARPAVGARTLRFTHISNWIEQKLSKEFEKVLVLPNMEDIIIDIMTPTPVQFE